MITLNDCGVVFESENHTYTLDGAYLSGVTGALSRTLFRGQYDDVPESVLEKAKKRGTKVHADCQALDDLGIDMGTDEVAGYRELTRELGLICIANEYTVSDMQHYASRIDKVFTTEDGEVIISDIKTTYKFNNDYVRWQLSIYAMMMEVVNPHLRVDRLLGLWLRGSHHEAIWIDRIPAEECRRLLECDRNGTQYAPLPEVAKTTEVASIEEIKPLITYYREVSDRIAQLEREREEFRMAAMKAMRDNGVKSWKCNGISLTYIPETESTTIDSARLKKEHPELVKEYSRKTTRKETIRIEIKD